ncbi:MAG: ShlB/FhaC/HecB family hemolysin secretion/activation protein [Succinivibrio sp.]
MKLPRKYLLSMLALAASSAVSMELSNVIVSSNVNIDRAVMDRRLNPYLGCEIDIHLLENILNEISDYYRQQGYLAAQAFYPEQQSSNGVIKVVVKTTKLNEIKISNLAGLSAKAANRLTYGIRSFQGKDINTDELNSRLLKLRDLNVFDVAGYFDRSRTYPDRADLSIDLKGSKRFGYQAFYDNYGSKATGKNRLTGVLSLHNLTSSADTAYALFSRTDKGQNNFGIDYMIPVNSHPTVVGASVNYGSYELADEYDDLDVRGVQSGLDIFVREPIIRNNANRTDLSGGVYYKMLKDRIRSYDISLNRDKYGLYGLVTRDLYSDSYTFANQFKLNYGYVAGRNDITKDSDRGYLLANLDSSFNWNFYGSFFLNNTLNAQFTSSEVDASDKFIPCGAYAVSAYESSLASSDQGVFDNLKVGAKLFNYPAVSLYTSFMHSYARNSKGGDHENFSAASIGADLSYRGFFVDTSVSRALGKNREFAKDSTHFLIRLGYVQA